MIKLLAKRLFQKNKWRNLVAITAIVMTTVMFTTLFVLSQSISRNMVEMAFRQTGFDTQVSIKDITDDAIEKIGAHPKVTGYGRSIVLGVAGGSSLAGRQVEIRYGSDSYAEHTFSMPTTGRMPEAEGEIALDTMVLERLGIPFELGQQVTLEWFRDMTGNELTANTFTLSGYWEGNASSYASMAWVSEEFALAACGGAETNEEGQVLGMRMMHVSLNSDKGIEKTMDQILADTGLSGLDYDVNLAFDPSMQATAAAESLPMYLGMVLVFMAGYLIIYNIFQISVATDIAFYGKLKTLGTTKKQIRRLILSQANRLCLIGIPVGLLLGYLLGAVLVPVLVAGMGERPVVSAAPVIFIGSTVFVWLTVLLSCLRPAASAGKVSPVEALRYTDAVTSGKKTSRKSHHSASLSDMAWSNLGRNRKRTVIVICSLTLGLVLMSCFYAKDASFDMEKYLSGLTISDFQVSDATSEDHINGYDPYHGTITQALQDQVAALEGLEETGSLYSQELTLKLSETAVGNIRRFFEDTGRVAEMERDVSWTQEYYDAVESGYTSAVVYGGEGLTLDVLSEQSYLMDGDFERERFETGEYILAFGPSVDNYAEQMPTFSVGEKVKLEDREYTVMAIVYPLQPIIEGFSASNYNLKFMLPASEFRRLWPDNQMRKLYFNIAEEKVDAAQEMLLAYQKETDSSMSFESRDLMVEQYERETRSSAVMGNVISVVIALVGVLNFVNSMVTAIVSRRKEFAMIQSVGMTKKQLRTMLILEGLYYAALTLICSYLFSALGVGVGVRAMVEGGFATFRFTLAPLLVCTPLILGFAVLVPFLCFRNLEKQSIVERLRTD